MFKRFQNDVDAILARRLANGGDYWASADGRWGVGSPFSTFDVGLMLAELGLKRTDPIAKGIAKLLLQNQEEDGRIRPGPKLPVQPCHTANAARVLCRLGHAKDRNLKRTFAHLLDIQHTDGGWRCTVAKLGRSGDTDASNPGVTLAVLDAFRFTEFANTDARLDAAVKTLIKHWSIRRPLGPCRFGIGTQFMRVEYPFCRYNLFFYVYVLSFYERARNAKPFRKALNALEAKLVEGSVVIESQRPALNHLVFCRKGEPSQLATKRWREIVHNVGRSAA